MRGSGWCAKKTPHPEQATLSLSKGSASKDASILSSRNTLWCNDFQIRKRTSGTESHSLWAPPPRYAAGKPENRRREPLGRQQMPDALERTAIRKVYLRLLPVALLIYFL